jgi:hypothetical protein
LSFGSGDHILGSLRPTSARFAGGLFLGDGLFVIGSTNSRRQYGQVQTRLLGFDASFTRLVTVAAVIVAATCVAIIAVIAFRTIAAVAAIIAIIPLAALRTAIFVIVLACVYAGISLFAFVSDIALIIAPIAIFAAVAVIAAPFALRTAFFLTAAIVGEHTEIMVGKLQIIFRIHPVAIMLGVLRKLFIFFQHLRGVAARTVVDPILVIITVAIVVLRTIIIAPTAAAVGLAIIHKDLSVLIKCNLISVFCALCATALCDPLCLINALGQFCRKEPFEGRIAAKLYCL